MVVCKCTYDALDAIRQVEFVEFQRDIIAKRAENSISYIDIN